MQISRNKKDSISKNIQRGNSNVKILQKDIIKPILLENTQDYFEHTTFHGLKFIGDSKISWIERFVFLIAFITSATIAIIFINDVYIKWSSTPFIIAINSSSTHITKLPFPAVTICNMNQALLSQVKHFRRGTEEYTVLRRICDSIHKRRTNSTRARESRHTVQFRDFFYQTAQPCERMILNCEFGSVKLNCSEIFKPVLTDEGLCCSFNIHHPTYMFKSVDPNGFHSSNYYHQNGAVPVSWDTTKGYQQNLPKNYYPRPGLDVGISKGLKLILNAEINEYHCSTTNGLGFKVNIHNPTEIRPLKHNGLIIGVGVESRTELIPIIFDSSENIQSIAKKLRQCVFDGEYTLKYFTHYTQSNCEMECKAKIILEKCNCSHYFMPRLQSNITDCKLKDLQCVENILQGNETDIECNDDCLPGCFELDFKYNSYAIPIKRSNFHIKNKIIQNMTNEKYENGISELIFYYNEQSYYSQTRREFIGMTQFLSQTGGLMGLFLGFSVISIIEIFYFITFRPCCATYRSVKNIKNVGYVANNEHIQTVYNNIKT